MNIPSTPQTLSDLRLLDFTTLIKNLLWSFEYENGNFAFAFYAKEIHAVLISTLLIYSTDFMVNDQI